tara:strand:+ start:50 stop:199 length:150 start_codon:yes stop_codon:yes gene_type:complete
VPNISISILTIYGSIVDLTFLTGLGALAIEALIAAAISGSSSTPGRSSS